MSSEQNNVDPVIENTMVVNANDGILPIYSGGNNNNNNASIPDVAATGQPTEQIHLSAPLYPASPPNSRRTSKASALSDASPQRAMAMARRMTSADSKADIDWFSQREYIMFKHELASQRKINNFILKECKENKRLLDLKCDDLTKTVNNIQTSVIFVSTLSGFLQATKLQFGIPSDYIEVISITISTYIALILSISKYYKLDELKEQIQNLREKYSLLHNKIEHRMDVLGPWNNRHLWEYKNATDKLAEWREVLADMHEQYKNIIETKQALTTEFEIIMDTISRNKYNSINAYLNFNNRTELFTVQTKEADLENTIVSKQVHFPKHAHPTIILQHEALDNWDDEESVV
jgi:archaellum component FlaC